MLHSESLGGFLVWSYHLQHNVTQRVVGGSLFGVTTYSTMLHSESLGGFLIWSYHLQHNVTQQVVRGGSWFGVTTYSTMLHSESLGGVLGLELPLTAQCYTASC